MLEPDAAGGLYAIHDRHADVHEHHIWFELSDSIQSLLAIVGLAHDLDILRAADDGLESHSGQQVVLYEYDAYG